MRERLNRNILSILIFVFIMAAAAIPALAVDVNIDGKNLEFNDNYGYPFIDSANRTQVPFRMTMEAYGCTVSWDSAGKIAIAEKDGTTVKVPIGQKYILVNGETVPNDTVALIKNSRTYLPIRAVLEAFGAKVSWDSIKKIVSVISGGNVNKPTVNPGDKLQIHFIDVGQGDSILVDFGSTEILIDAGPQESGTKLAAYLNKYVDGDLDYVIITHLDSDHVGGLLGLYSKYSTKLGKIIYSGEDYEAMLKEAGYGLIASALKLINLDIVEDSDMTLDIGSGLKLKIIETGDDYEDNNDSSVVAELIYGNFKALFTGDMSSKVEKANLNKFEDVDVLKVGHHGSRTATSVEFLNVIKPEAAVISYLKGNSFGHPHYLALSRLIEAGIDVYGTGKSGTIILETDGTNYTFNTSTKLTLDDAADMVDTNTVINPLPEGGYYLGNKTSKRFHLSTCENGQSMAQSNRIVFATREEAIAAGYIPCKVCCP